jgi:hypothetical protein
MNYGERNIARLNYCPNPHFSWVISHNAKSAKSWTPTAEKLYLAHQFERSSQPYGLLTTGGLISDSNRRWFNNTIPQDAPRAAAPILPFNQRSSTTLTASALQWRQPMQLLINYKK